VEFEKEIASAPYGSEVEVGEMLAVILGGLLVIFVAVAVLAGVS
jgi:hypothetical protein